MDAITIRGQMLGHKQSSSRELGEGIQSCDQVSVAGNRAQALGPGRRCWDQGPGAGTRGQVLGSGDRFWDQGAGAGIRGQVLGVWAESTAGIHDKVAASGTRAGHRGTGLATAGTSRVLMLLGCWDRQMFPAVRETVTRCS